VLNKEIFAFHSISFNIALLYRTYRCLAVRSPCSSNGISRCSVYDYTLYYLCTNCFCDDYLL